MNSSKDITLGKKNKQRLHLDGTARDVFRILPETERDSFSHAFSALKKIFRPVNIEELCGLEFHHHMQGSDTSKQLELQSNI